MQKCNVYGSFKFAGSVLAVEAIGEHLYVFDSNYFISKISLKQTKCEFRVQIIKTAQNPIHEYSKAISFGRGHECVVSLEGSPKVNVLSLQSDKITKKRSFELPSSSMSISVFSSSGDFLAVGSVDGDLFLFKNQSGGTYLLKQIEKMGDAVSSASFSPGDDYLCVSYYNKKSIIYDIRRNEIIASFHTEAIVEKSLFFPNQTGVACVCRDGGLEIYDMTCKQHLYRHHFCSFWPTDAVFLNDNIIVASTREGVVLFFDIEEQFVATSISFRTPITRMLISGDKLFVCFCDGMVYAINLEHKIDEFLVFVKTDRLDEASALCEHNTLLSLLPEFKKTLKDSWDNKLKEISSLLAKGDFEKANKIAKPYLILPSIAANYQSLLSQTAEIAEFFDAIEAKDYAAAYKIAYATANIQKLPIFHDLEATFLRAVKATVELLETTGLSDKQAVLSNLKPFLGVPQKRAIIEDILKNWGNYEKAVVYFKNKQFKEFFAVCEKSQFLKECNLYKKASALAQEIVSKINTYESKMEYQNAIKLAKLLCDFLPYREEGQKRVKSITLRMELNDAILRYKNGESCLEEIFDMVEENRELEDFHIFGEFVENIKKGIEVIYQNRQIVDESSLAKIEEYRAIPYLARHIDFLESIDVADKADCEFSDLRHTR